MEQAKKVVLASSSPRRQAFLRELGLAFVVLPADIDETPLPNEEPVALALRLASSKAAAVAERSATDHNSVVIAADTVVALGDLILGKPDDRADAYRMLRALKGRAHEVHSALSVLDKTNGQLETVVNTTTVWMRSYSDADIESYVESGDPMDKAGAYAIQHPDFDPAVSVEGCLSSVMGLPLEDLRRLLEQAGIVIPKDVGVVCQAQTHFPCCCRQR